MLPITALCFDDAGNHLCSFSSAESRIRHWKARARAHTRARAAARTNTTQAHTHAHTHMNTDAHTRSCEHTAARCPTCDMEHRPCCSARCSKQRAHNMHTAYHFLSMQRTLRRDRAHPAHICAGTRSNTGRSARRTCSTCPSRKSAGAYRCVRVCLACACKPCDVCACVL